MIQRVVSIVAVLGLLAFMFACCGCEGYQGAFTVGYTGKTPQGNDFTVGLSLPIQKPKPVVLPAVSAKEVANVQP